MATIVPRWEWRTFGAHFGIAETRFAQLTPGAVQESDELYFLGGSGANVKVRDDLLDIKVLREVSAEGLERWEPVMKQPFPLSAADAAKVFASLGLAAPRSPGTPPPSTSSSARPSRRVGCCIPSGSTSAESVTPSAAASRSSATSGRRAGPPAPSRSKPRTRSRSSRPSHRLASVDTSTRTMCSAWGAARRCAGALRGDRRGHEFGQAACGRA